jgi:hypothetical protein
MFEKNSNRFVILEAKGNTSRLRSDQMTDSWIRQNLNKLHNNGTTDYQKLQTHINGIGKTHGMWATLVKVYAEKNEFNIGVQIQTYEGVDKWNKVFK